MKRKLYRVIMFLLLGAMNAAAQTEGFKYAADIKPVDSSGFYNIVLTPELNAHLKVDYSDLRVVDDSGKWVPHLVRIPRNETSGEQILFDMKTIEKDEVGGSTKIILEGKKKDISYLMFGIKNSSVKRYCTLSGSDDSNSWYIINDSIEIVIDKIDQSSNGIFILRFPPVNYKYYKVIINNNGRELLYITGAKTIWTDDIQGKLHHYTPLENEDTKVTQKDSSKISYIKVEQSKSYHFDEFSMKVSGAKYFNRTAELFIPESSSHSFANPGKLIQTFTVSNNSTLHFNISTARAKVFYIIVYNDDNPPLKVEGVKTFSAYQVASVYLDKSKQYQLLMENESVSSPKYDLSLDDIPFKKLMPTATIKKMSSLQKPTLPAQPKPNSKKYIWLALAIAALVLGFFTYRLVTDMNKSKS